MDFKDFFPQDLHQNLVEDFQKQKKNTISISGVGNNTSKVFFLRKLIDRIAYNQNLLWVTQNTEQALEIYKNLINFTNLPVFLLSQTEQSNENNLQLQEIETVYRLNQKSSQATITVTDYRSIDFKTLNYSSIQKESLLIQKNQTFKTTDLFNKVIELGYVYSQEQHLQKGEYCKTGDVLSIFPVNSDVPLKIETDFDQVANIWTYLSDADNQILQHFSTFEIFPLKTKQTKNTQFIHTLNSENLLILDEIDEINEDFSKTLVDLPAKQILFTSFPKEVEEYTHLRYLSVLKFYNLFDFLNDLKDKIYRDWEIVILVKKVEEIENILTAEKILFSKNLKDKIQVKLVQSEENAFVPSSFQNPEQKIAFITDKELYNIKKKNKNKNIDTLQMEILTSLREGDFVVHFDHGIGKFVGIKQIEIDQNKREYLEIHYLEGDKLFVPIDQADKVSRFIGGEGDTQPRLSRLGGTDWKNITRKIKKETQKIAKELLKLYAKRAQAQGFKFLKDNQKQAEFEAKFPYEETPGQIKAIQDIKNDMEKPAPMDRLICGDVGFGKTEVALRAAFKAVQSQKQVALISPITILTDQHYKTFQKRMEGFGVRIEMLSRFRTQAEQKKIVQDLKKGKIDIIIGTHRLLQEDIEFFDLGLVIIDEEQRFGVKQKERLKSFRTSVDVLTLTATPIPRTLNMSLHKLRDITTITTPPPGRLPIITEVRKYSDALIKDAVEKEIERDGQVYFLHNRVETIEAIAHKLRQLIPQAKVIVAHGQLNPNELEERILKFKEKEFNVLVSSTIIENGIDLPNANTLIINNTEMFGLSQLYQLRGRIGRGKKQAYAYFLYHTQKLKTDARKRLKAIVEASELGSGFQIAMKDLEIRGAGDVLGANQHGSINVVGVNHFIRLLNQTIHEMKEGERGAEEKAQEDVQIEIPFDAYIPNTYISDAKEKILTYQRIASIKDFKDLTELKTEIIEEFGLMPVETSNLFKIIDLKLIAKQANIQSIKAISQGNQGKEIVLKITEKVTAKHIINLLQYNQKWRISENTLKIDIKDLGFNWLEEIRNSLEKLSQKIA